jgi:hypothetical protein
MIVTAALVVGVAGCSSSSSGGVDGGSDIGGAGLGPQVTVAFDISGAVSLKGKQNAAVPSNEGKPLADCAAYAKGSTDKNGRTFYTLAELLDGKVAGQDVSLQMWIKDYRGPGTYPKNKLVAQGQDAGVAVNNKTYVIHDSTSSTATTDGKGGGVWSFSKLAVTGPDGRPGAAVSGSVKWTCRD